MSTPVKLILGFVLGAVLTCVLIAVLGLTIFRSAAVSVLSDVQAEPGEAAQVAAEIAAFTLPAGYTSAVATQIAHLEVVGYDSPSGDSHIYLFQLPPFLHVDQAELERQLRSATESEGNAQVVEMKVIEQQAVTIRGQATTLVVSEGINGAGRSIRSASAVFAGNDGQALLSFSGPTSAWDAALIIDFINSMH
jgi:hypothetical protein